MDPADDAALSHATRMINTVLLLFLVLGAWAYFSPLDEVSKGDGKVIPSSHEQIIQSLEGGILAELKVAEGDLVEVGQVLAQLDATKTQSNVEESTARYRAVLASATRLQAEVSGTALSFPDELLQYPELITRETRLHRERTNRLKESLSGVNQSLQLVDRELRITQTLASQGVASDVEVFRLQRQRSELQLKMTELRSAFQVQASEELTKARAEISSLSAVIRGREDSLNRMTVLSPVRGIVKGIEVTTIGGVVSPNGRLMQIVPVDDQLLIETRISPRDIAFIHPDQAAKVKITAYDYSIYGGLDGQVVTISPDTIQDKVKPENYYYRVFIRTHSSSLQNKAGKQFPIAPGMIATVDIKTGSKTVLSYLVKPFNKAREALRER
ncbi:MULTISPECIES: HlyD family type I secretion periplasmic adaptor subunit [Pseudomonas]|uniref:Membrane fusion protein (MFP) family protein n=1 Tax=Pseudomonas lactis TaxID=1615674 RepID=A0ABS9FXY4_9PSED|nr:MULTISPECIES: HlyD family type I secretion periplasmic adaptor subunit [Pseudomonas]MBI6979295.1 HlyD family type I secretion periplasmic adaptor subunit [Pseudomonas lactis]MCF5004648.1 HlyD family type I secretion periplasmic adaptor subunit [Pseudomonas lactis]MCF5010134.1 HlyD family type I secretion periplasmic adaptor subunit [Pseudomonas lactis]MCF5016068.1 HlyD family type I secretion periplasmic adaptor subunit [Pseudomonas lactis]MCF5019630.1 HlyD family type I secretion periplasm